jgi:hypothetical protein
MEAQCQRRLRSARQRLCNHPHLAWVESAIRQTPRAICARLMCGIADCGGHRAYRADIGADCTFFSPEDVIDRGTKAYALD